jgi:PAS domain S-box-containing protein
LLEALGEIDQGTLIVEGERILHASEACAEISGYGVAELLSLPSPIELFVPEERTMLLERLRERTSGERAVAYYESTVLHKDGRRIDVEVAVKPLRINGHVRRLAVILRDITGRKRAETKIRGSSQRD